jgi:predicted kinase
MKKIVYILRAVSGAGKTTLAESLCDTIYSSVICCADDYFTDIETGEYNWNVEALESAHKWCQAMFKEHLEDETDIIVVSNTNVMERDVNTYRNLALEYGYKVFVLTVENWHNGKDVHNVPEETKIAMKSKLLNSMKL